MLANKCLSYGNLDSKLKCKYILCTISGDAEVATDSYEYGAPASKQLLYRFPRLLSERSLLQPLNTRSRYLRRKRKPQIHFRAFIWYSTFIIRFYCKDVSCFRSRDTAILDKRRLSGVNLKVLKHVLCSWQFDGSNLQSVNTWRSLSPPTWIRSSVNGIRAFFNIHVFRNRMHIASYNRSRTAVDSVLYYATFSSFFWFCGVSIEMKTAPACVLLFLYEPCAVEIELSFVVLERCNGRAAGVSG